MIDESDISDLVNITDWHTKLSTLARKVELKAEQDKIVRTQTHNLSFFLGYTFFGDDGFQNMFVCQPTRELIR